MKRKKIVVNTKFGLVDYIVLVNEIVAEFFDEDGGYQPHIGMLNIIRLFYNYCVLESKFDIPHDITDAMDMETIVDDDDFLEAFNDALLIEPEFKLDFANAYKNAMDIVDNKRTSVEYAVDSIKKMFSSIVDMLSPLLTDENVNIISDIAKNMTNGNIDAEAIVEAYGKSEVFKQLKESKIKESKKE